MSVKSIEYHIYFTENGRDYALAWRHIASRGLFPKETFDSLESALEYVEVCLQKVGGFLVDDRGLRIIKLETFSKIMQTYSAESQTKEEVEEEAIEYLDEYKGIDLGHDE